MCLCPYFLAHKMYNLNNAHSLNPYHKILALSTPLRLKKCVNLGLNSCLKSSLAPNQHFSKPFLLALCPLKSLCHSPCGAARLQSPYKFAFVACLLSENKCWASINRTYKASLCFSCLNSCRHRLKSKF